MGKQSKLGKGLRVTLATGYPPDPAVRKDLVVVAESVRGSVELMFGKEPPGPRRAVCSYRVEGPQIVARANVCKIGLTVIDRSYCRFVYQLAHELGHMMFQPLRTNWLLETLAVAVSLDVLRRSAINWAKAAPFDSWTSYAESFTTYEQEEVADRLTRLPEVEEAVQLEDWGKARDYFVSCRSEMESWVSVEALSSERARDLQTLGALILLSSEVSWAEFVGIGSHTDPTPAEDRSIRFDLPLLFSECPDDLDRLGL